MSSYRHIFTENKSLFQQLENCTYELIELRPIQDEARINELFDLKKEIKMKIYINLELLEYLWAQEKVRIARVAKRIDYKEDNVIHFYKQNRSMPITIMAAKLAMPIDDVNRIITQHLVKKHA